MRGVVDHDAAGRRRARRVHGGDLGAGREQGDVPAAEIELRRASCTFEDLVVAEGDLLADRALGGERPPPRRPGTCARPGSSASRARHCRWRRRPQPCSPWSCSLFRRSGIGRSGAHPVWLRQKRRGRSRGPATCGKPRATRQPPVLVSGAGVIGSCCSTTVCAVFTLCSCPGQSALARTTSRPGPRPKRRQAISSCRPPGSIDLAAEH